MSTREQLYALMGELPDRNRPLSSALLSREAGPDYVLETLTLDLNGIEAVPALFVRPLDGDRFPVILYNHAHGGAYELGKAELTRGRSLLQQPPYALELCRRGFAALCIDHWAFGERRGRTESEIFKQMLWEGRAMWGMMVFDSLRAIDYLVSRPDVLPDRIGTLGLSMGSTMAWWTAALVPRIKVCIDLCCMTDFHSLVESRGLDGHGVYYYVPGLLKHFTTAQINALIAPRPHLCLAANHDPLTPPAGLDRIDAALRDVYAKQRVPERWRMVRYDVGHLETAAMRREVVDFLARWL